MKALVLGASGHLGNAVVRELLSQGWNVTAAWHRGTSPANLAGLDIRPVVGDDRVVGQLAAWIAGHDLVVDAAAPYALQTLTRGREPRAAHAAERTSQVLAAVQAADARLIFFSSFVTQTRPRQAVLRRFHPYFSLKRQLEEQVVSAARQGLRAVVVNPTLCLGPWDRKPEELAFVPQLLRGDLPLRFRHLVNVIDVRDAARVALAALDQERYGEPLLVAGHNVQVEELFAWICEAAGVALPRFSMRPREALLPALGLESLAVLWGRSYTPFLGVLLLAELGRCDGTALRELGVQPTSLSLTVRDTVAWYRSSNVAKNL